MINEIINDNIKYGNIFLKNKDEDNHTKDKNK